MPSGFDRPTPVCRVGTGRRKSALQGIFLHFHALDNYFPPYAGSRFTGGSLGRSLSIPGSIPAKSRGMGPRTGDEQIAVSPTVALMANIVSATGGPMDEDYINYIVLPAVTARFAVADAPSLYVGGELNYSIPNTTRDEIEFSFGGLGYGALIGFAFGGWAASKPAP
jgi:hypothetical protein